MTGVQTCALPISSTDSVRTATERRDEDLDDATKQAAKKLTEHLPRSRLAPYLQTLIADNASTDTVRTATERRDEDLDDATKEAATKLTHLRASCPIAGWSHAADLWDYVKIAEGAQP